MRRTLAFWASAAAGLCFGGCATTGSMGADTVSDSDLGRLQAPQTQPIQQAQQTVMVAEHRRDQAALQLDQAKDHVAAAQPTIDGAQADIKAAEAQIDAAQATGDPKRIDAAQHALDAAKLEKRVRKAQVDYLAREVDLRGARLDLADRQLELVQARAEQSKLQALQQAHNPAANKYSPAIFETRVEGRQQAVSDAETTVRTAEQKANLSFETWEASRRTYAEMQGLIPVRGGGPGQNAAPLSHEQKGNEENAQPPAEEQKKPGDDTAPENWR